MELPEIFISVLHASVLKQLYFMERVRTLIAALGLQEEAGVCLSAGSAVRPLDSS